MLTNGHASSTGGLPPMSDPVRGHYERWVYPAPIGDLRQMDFNAPDSHFRDLRELYWAYWPTAAYRENLDILVAGCGSNAAVCYALLYPTARVVGIDISTASLEHEQRLKDKHQLKNLTLHACDIENVAELGQTFDMVICHGVLHHLANPAAGLRALGGIMRPSAVIAIMVYAQYAKTGVYMLRDMFRLLNLEQDAAGLAVVKDTLPLLGAEHPARRGIQLTDDVKSDNGLIDLFLHRRERAYTVADCLEMVNNAGLTFQGWDENGLYYPEGQIPARHPLRAAIDRLAPPQLWQAMELFHGNTPGHWFYACKKDRPEAEYRIDFEDDRFLGYIPVERAKIVSQASEAGQSGFIGRLPFPQVPLTPVQMRVFTQVNAERSVLQCLKGAGVDGDERTRKEFGLNFFRTLWRLGYMHFRLPSQP